MQRPPGTNHCNIGQLLVNVPVFCSQLMIERWTGERWITSLMNSCQKQSAPNCRSRGAAAVSSATHLIVRRMCRLPLPPAPSSQRTASAAAASLLSAAVRAGFPFCARRWARGDGGDVRVKAACWSSAIVVKKASLSVPESASASGFDLVRVHIHRAEREPGIVKNKAWAKLTGKFLLIYIKQIWIREFV